MSGDNAMWERIDLHSSRLSELDKRLTLTEAELARLHRDHKEMLESQSASNAKMEEKMESISGKMDTVIIAISKSRGASDALKWIIPIAFAALIAVCGVSVWIYSTFVMKG